MGEKQVIEIDQHSSTADQIEEWSYTDWIEVIESLDSDHVPRLSGGDAEAAQAIHGGHYEIKQVSDSESPPWGMVWYVEGEDGSMEIYEHNFATK